MNTFDQVLQKFGERIRDLRKQKGFSQEAFSFECKLDRTYVSQVEQGRRNISLHNIKAMADALRVPVADLFPLDLERLDHHSVFELRYHMKDDFLIDCGFSVSGMDIQYSSIDAAKQLQSLPFSLYQTIDLKTLSSIVGAIFVDSLAKRVSAIVNPIEKGHPDIIPASGRSATESELRNYPQGLEIKVTVGNVRTGSHVQPGSPRVSSLTGITWQAHHREIESLLGMVVDFAGQNHDGKRFPMISGVFFSDQLTADDWGEISGISGRNTKVTGMKSSGKQKMGQGWILILDQPDYISKYSGLMGITRL